MSAVTCEEQATPPDSPKRARPPGCADFSPLRRCSSVTDRRGYALSSRLGETKNRQQRGMAEFFNRLLIARKEKRRLPRSRGPRSPHTATSPFHRLLPP